MKSLCILCAHHRPDDARVFHREARTLRGLFEKITLVCPHERRSDLIDGISISGIDAGGSYWNRARLVQDLYCSAACVDADVYLCHELDSLAVGCAIQAGRPRSRLVFDCHEYHPESFSEHVPSFAAGAARNALAAAEQLLVRRCDMVVTVNEILAAKFCKFCNNVHVIENFPPRDDWDRASLSSTKRFDLVYGGHMNLARGASYIAEMLTAAKYLGRTLKMCVVGRFLDAESERYVQTVTEKESLEPWYVTGTVDHKEVGKYLSQAKIGLVCDQPDVWRHAQGGVPVKLFEYMAASLPILANDFPFLRRIVHEGGIGRCVDVTDSRSYASVALEMLDNPELLTEMGKRAREAVRTKYCWEQLQPKLLGAYRSLIGQ